MDFNYNGLLCTVHLDHGDVLKLLDCVFSLIHTHMPLVQHVAQQALCLYVYINACLEENREDY